MNKIYIKPTPEKAIVRDPVTGHALPSSGAQVADTTYWRRRLRDGDCRVMKKPEINALQAESKRQAQKPNNKKSLEPETAAAEE